jgi:hypothetical protein
VSTWSASTLGDGVCLVIDKDVRALNRILMQELGVEIGGILRRRALVVVGRILPLGGGIEGIGDAAIERGDNLVLEVRQNALETPLAEFYKSTQQSLCVKEWSKAQDANQPSVSSRVTS